MASDGPLDNTLVDSDVETVALQGEGSDASAWTVRSARTGLIASRYEIEALVGRGGAGNVYRVRDLELGEVVALKTLHRELVTDERAVDRFRAEVRLARRVTHRNVVRTFDFGNADGVPYLTMEFVDGEPLDSLIAARGVLDPATALEIARDVCEGLIAAHEAGVIHQDLKPQNVLIQRDGRVVISDFGIARAREASAVSRGFTGTPAYMSPEQVSGVAVLDARTDVYGVGMLLFEMLSGRRPFNGATPIAIALARVTQPAPELVEHPRVVRDIVARCLEREREARFESAETLRDALADALGAMVTVTNPIMPTLQAHKPASAKSVAVLPLALRGDEAMRHLVDGVLEELIDGLSMTPGLAAKPAATVMRPGTAGDPIADGRRLGVEVVVEGSLMVVGETLHLRLAALSVSDGFQLWARRFEGTTGELFAMCGEAVSAIAGALTLESGAQPSELTDPVTIDLYMRARQVTAANWHFRVDRAHDLWEKLLERAPDDPRVLAGAARYFARFANVKNADPDALQRAERYVARAIEMRPDWPEPYCARAVIAWNRFDLGAALADARRALALAPGYGEALVMAGRVLLETGPLDEALSLLKQAHDADPYEYGPRWELVRGHALLGNWSEVDSLLSLRVDGASHLFMQRLMMARTDLWRPQPRWLDEEEVDHPRSALAFYLPMAKAIAATGALPPNFEEVRQGVHRFAEGGGRMACVPLQHMTEFASRAGRFDIAVEMLQAAIDHGLRDLIWLLHCPLLVALQDTEEHRSAVATVRRRLGDSSWVAK